MTNTFDDIFDSVKDFAVKAGKKTTEIVDVSKLKLEVVSLNNEIRKNYEKLGSLIYNSRKDGKSGDELAGICIAEIDALYAKVEECNAKIDETKKIIRCPSCGTANNIIATYCYVCGTKLVREEPKAEECAEEKCAEEKTSEENTEE